MNCQEYQTLISDLAAGHLPPADGERLLDHAEGCAQCAAVLDTTNALWEDLERLPLPPSDPAARERLMTAVRDTAPLGQAMRLLRRTAAIAAVFLLGILAGRLGSGGQAGQASEEEANLDGTATASQTSATVQSPGDPQFILLLRENMAFTGALGPEIEGEYAAWAGELAGDGRLVAAQKLTEDPGRWLQGREAQSIAVPGQSVSGGITGFFVITARDLSHATRIAESIPHLGYGGIVELREIEAFE